MNEAKRFLSEYGRMRSRIKRLNMEVLQIRDQAESISAWTDGDRVQSSHQPDKLGQVVARLVDKETETLEVINEYIDKMNEIDDMLNEIEDPKLALILELRYKQGLIWEKVAEEMNYDVRWVQRLHGRALEEINKILNRP